MNKKLTLGLSLSLALAGCGPAAAVPTLVATAAPFVSVIAPTTPISYPTLPPEWTATPTPAVTDTPLATATLIVSDTPEATVTSLPSATRRVPTRTVAPTLPAATKAPVVNATPQLLFQLSGNGSGNTQPLTINNGRVEIDWNYAGSPGGGTLSPERESYHTEVLNELKSAYDSDMAYYQAQERDAAAKGDALRFSQLQQQANARTGQYNNDVAAENARYQAEKAAASKSDNTTFGLWGSAADGSGQWYVDGTTGPGHGVSQFVAAGGSHFIFQVKASGPWSLTIYWQPS